jgi:formate/nitrite transporter FocA (FNT family)
VSEAGVQSAFDAERDDLARRTLKGIGMPVAGMLYWIGATFVLRAFPQKTALVVCFAMTGAVFPLGAALTRVMGGDLFAKSRSLTPLGIQLAAVQLFYWPVIIVVFRQAPEWTPYTLAVLFGSHFLPYGWLYASRAYALLAALVAVTLSAAVLYTGSPMYFTAPVVAAACYVVAITFLWREVARLRRPGDLPAHK